MSYDPADQARRDFEQSQQARMREAREFQNYRDQQRYNSEIAHQRRLAEEAEFRRAEAAKKK